MKKKEAAQTEIEFLGQRSDVFRFALPVDAARDQVLAFHEHIGSSFKDVEHILLVVLAAQTKQHASVHLNDHELLQYAVRFSYLDSQRTILAAYAFPERGVAIQHDHFVGVSFQVEDGSNEGGTDSRVTLRRVRDVTHAMTVWIIITADGI